MVGFTKSAPIFPGSVTAGHRAEPILFSSASAANASGHLDRASPPEPTHELAQQGEHRRYGSAGI